MTFSIMSLNVMLLETVMLCVIMVSVMFFFIVILSVGNYPTMLSVITLRVIVLNVVAPCFYI